MSAYRSDLVLVMFDVHQTCIDSAFAELLSKLAASRSVQLRIVLNKAQHTQPVTVLRVRSYMCLFVATVQREMSLSATMYTL